VIKPQGSGPDKGRKPAPRHDPLLCGLCRRLCPGCAAEPPPAPPLNSFDQLRERWHQLQLDHQALLRGDPLDLEPPAALSGVELRRLLVTLLDPRHRALFREVLVEVLAEPVAAIALGVVREVERAR
jgi:hypothetical protein